MKQFNNNTHNYTNNNSNDGKIRDKISDIRMMLYRLGITVTNNDREKITKTLCEAVEKKKHLAKEKEEIYDNLVKIVKSLDKKEEYKHHDRDDLDY